MIVFTIIGLLFTKIVVLYVIVFKLPCWLGFHRYEDTTGFSEQKTERCRRCHKTKYN